MRIAARHALSRLDDDTLAQAFAESLIVPDTTWADAVRIKREAAAARVAAENAARNTRTGVRVLRRRRARQVQSALP